ncbi:TIGR02270 family protein [Pyxidicoccus fallax]|uniref:TIGR02270 family protein n=1 Tax=Pyxidicoccus fallax TaxID=394095 RepID=A0A848LNC7_9BACT|nr:TIGR02270 family protein [Pyxidicoccus fallax]NMO19246.1 TIGR02270 family protein [Pyxidicoccus fallax]NPC79817.1 TIGR02270 family protein [Pyxidicoccus fallax]
MMVDVFEEHLAEASFLWSQWEQALVAPDFTLDEAAGVEERMLAHLDGLSGAGALAVEALTPLVNESADPGEVFAATWTLLALSPSVALEAVKARAGEAPPLVGAALRRAMELAEDAGMEATLVSWLTTSEPVPRALALEVLTFRGRAPANVVVELLGHPEGAVSAAALRALRPSSKVPPPRELEALLGDTRPEVRRAAFEAGLLFGMRQAWAANDVDPATCTGALRKQAWVLRALVGEEKALERIIAALKEEAAREDALWALGFSGRRTAADACLEAMAGPPRVARLAGEAFSAITGLRLEERYALPEEEPGDALPPLEEEDLDADLSLHPEDALPRPAPTEIARWWQTVRKDFAPSSRYLGGHPFTGAGLLEALSQGPMRRRHVHAQELLLRTQGAQAVQVRAFSARQRDELARASAIRERLPAWAFGA